MNIIFQEINYSEFDKIEKEVLGEWKKEFKRDVFFNLFNAKYLNFIFRNPGKLKHPFFGAYCNGELVGTIGSVITDVIVRGEEYKFAICGWLTVNSNVKKLTKRSVYLTLMNGLYDWYIENKIDLMLGYIEQGHIVRNLHRRFAILRNEVVEDLTVLYPIVKVLNYEKWKMNYEESSLENRLLKNSQYLKIPEVKKYRDSIKCYRKEDIDRCLKLLNRIKDRVKIAQIFEKEELDWLLDFPEISRTILFEKNGEVRGLINYISLESVGITTNKYALIDNIYINDLTSEQTKEFLSQFLHIAKEDGFTGVLDWSKGYYDQNYLYDLGFVRDKRYHDVCFNRINKKINISGIKSIYLPFR